MKVLILFVITNNFYGKIVLKKLFNRYAYCVIFRHSSVTCQVKYSSIAEICIPISIPIPCTSFECGYIQNETKRVKEGVFLFCFLRLKTDLVFFRISSAFF